MRAYDLYQGLNPAGRRKRLQGKLSLRGECAPPLPRVPVSWRMFLLCHDVLAMCLVLAARLRVVMTARSYTPLLLINQPLVFPHASPYPATVRLRACRSIARQPIAAVHDFLPVCTRVYAHALRDATDSETSIFDHEQKVQWGGSVLIVISKSNLVLSTPRNAR